MNNTFWIFFTIIIFQTSLRVSAQNTTNLSVEGVYQNYCASCHGSNFEGGLGGSLIDGKWKHGERDAEIYKIIKNGIADKGMIPYGNILSDDQLRSLVVYIRELENSEAYRNIEYPSPDPNEVTETQYHSYKVEILTEGLNTPWSLAFLPDGRKLVTERLGPLRIIDVENNLLDQSVENTPSVIFDGPEGGMMDIALHPDYENNGWIYLAFADGWREENNKSWSQTTIVRGRLKDNRWVDQQWIYKPDKSFYMQSGAHYGTRMAFADGYIYFIIGERGTMGDAQNLSRPNGKIMRLAEDGSIPTDNPFIDDATKLDEIWSFGHRNPQGLVIDNQNQKLYSTEHGARGGDEFNLILKGKNYGWPVITHGINYNGQPITALTRKEGMEQPIIHWTPSIAPCGLTQYTGSAFPLWDGDFLVGSLKAQELRRLRLENGQVIEQEVILKGLGRIRDVRTGPDGLIYILTDDVSRMIRLVPVNN